MQVTNLSEWAAFSSPDSTRTPEALDAWDAHLAEQRTRWPNLY